ncbi:unnamed protein product [Closterium sp. Naga37s-1]|nr:unnamed protein product [Closterium sp. Naga37s-1]
MDRIRGRPGSPALCAGGGRLAAMYRPTHHASRTDRLSPPADLSPFAEDSEQQLLGGPSGGSGGCGPPAHGGTAKEPALPRCTAVFGESGLVPPAPPTAAAFSLDDSDLASVVSESWTKCAASRRLASVAPSALPAQTVPHSVGNASSAPSATAPPGLPGSLSSGSLCGRFAAWGCADPLFAFERGALLVGESGISHAAETSFRARFPRAHPSAQASAGYGMARGSSASSISTSCQHSALHQRAISPSATAGHVADCLERTADSVGARQGQGGTAEGRDGRVVAGGGSSSGGKRRWGGPSSSSVLIGASSVHRANNRPASAVHAVASVAAGWEEAMGEADEEGMGEAMGCWAEGMGEAERAEGAREEDMEEGFELSEYLSLPDDLAWCAWPACDQVAVSRAVNPAGMSAGLGDVADGAVEGGEPQPNSFCRAHQALTSDARVRGGCLMSLLARMDGDGAHAHQPPASGQFSAPRSAHSPAPFAAPIVTAESSPRQRLQQLSPPPFARADAACGDEAAALLQRADVVAGLGAGTAPVAAERSVAGAEARGCLQGAVDGASGEGAAAEGLFWAALPDMLQWVCGLCFHALHSSPISPSPLCPPSTPIDSPSPLPPSAAWFRGLDVWEDAQPAQQGGREGAEGPAGEEGQGARACWDGELGNGEGDGGVTGAKGRARGRGVMAEAWSGECGAMDLQAGAEWADVGAAGAVGSGGSSEEHMQWQVEAHEGGQGLHAARLRGQGAAESPRAAPRAAAAHAAVGDGERKQLPAMPAAALPAAFPLAASPPSAAAAPLPASPAAAGGGAGGPSSAALRGAERRERRQRSSRAAAAAAAAAAGAGAGGKTGAGAARQVSGAATVGAHAGGGADGSGAVAGGTRADAGAAGVGGGAGGARFVPYHLWHQPAAPLMPPMLFVQPPFPPPHMPFPQAGAASAVMGGSVAGAMHPLHHSGNSVALVHGAASPRMFSALPAALATPPSAPATTAPAAAAPSAAPTALTPPPVCSAHAPPVLGPDPSHMHHLLFPPSPALYPAPPSLHPTCAARSAAAMMMAAATATAMARRRHLLGLAGEPVMKRKRGRQKKPPPRNGPCGATTNLRRIVPRAEGEEARDEGGAGADAGEVGGGAGGSRGKAAGGSGSGGGSSVVAGGAAAQGPAVSGGSGGGGRIRADKVGRVLSAAFGGGVGCAPVVGPVFMPRAYVPFPLTFHAMPQAMHREAIPSPFNHLAVPTATAAATGAASDDAAAALVAAVANAASPCATAAAAAASVHTVSSLASPPVHAAPHDSIGSGAALAAPGSNGAGGVDRMAAAPAPGAPNCAPQPALSSAGPPFSMTPPPGPFMPGFPAAATAASVSAEDSEGRVHGARLVSRILEMRGVDAEDCVAGMHHRKLAKVEQ